jgi:tetrahydromethanopterin S-methyltransferase subunit D
MIPLAAGAAVGIGVGYVLLLAGIGITGWAQAVNRSHV